METLEQRLQKRIHVSLYALLFLTTLLGLSVLLEGCTDKSKVTTGYIKNEPVHSTVHKIRESLRKYALSAYSIDPNFYANISFEENKPVPVNKSAGDRGWQPHAGTISDGRIAGRESMVSTFNPKAAITPKSGSGCGVGGSLAPFTFA